MAVKQSHQAELLRIIHNHVPNCTVWLFGSRATGKQRGWSDIDLALDGGSRIPWSTITKMLIEIDQTCIPMKVDLVDLYAVDDAFKMQVLKEGKKWTA